MVYRMAGPGAKLSFPDWRHCSPRQSPKTRARAYSRCSSSHRSPASCALKPIKTEVSSVVETQLPPSFRELIRLCCHYEVVSVQTTDLMCPPGDRYPTPLGQQRRVVPFLLGSFAYSVGESQCLGKVTEPENALQAFDAFPLHYMPLGDLRTQLCNLGVGKRRFVAPAGGARHLRQLAHTFHFSISL